MRFTDRLSGAHPDEVTYGAPIFVRHHPLDPYTATPGEKRAGIQRPHEVVPKPPPFEYDTDARKYMTGATGSVFRQPALPRANRTPPTQAQAVFRSSEAYTLHAD